MNSIFLIKEAGMVQTFTSMVTKLQVCARLKRAGSSAMHLCCDRLWDKFGTHASSMY